MADRARLVVPRDEHAARSMTREVWQRVKDILNEALDTPADARAAFLERACNGDAAIRAEVESLLASHIEAGDFIEPAAPAQPVTIVDSLHAGSDIGPYRIVQ